jgi:hypothetical protein
VPLPRSIDQENVKLKVWTFIIEFLEALDNDRALTETQQPWNVRDIDVHNRALFIN